MSTVIDTLITDRSELDVIALNNLIALIESGSATQEDIDSFVSASSKGAYNYTDLNRVGLACAYIYNQFATAGYVVSGYTALKTDWTTQDIPTQSDLTTYLATVNALRNELNLTDQIPDTMTGLGWNGANQIESLLVKLADLISKLSWIYTAQFNAYSWESNLYFGKAIRTWAELDALNTTWANWQVATWIDLLIGDLTETGVVE